MMTMHSIARAEAAYDPDERAYAKFCKDIVRSVGIQTVSKFESEVFGMFEDGATAEECATELQALEKASTGYLPITYLYPNYWLDTKTRILVPVDDFGNEVHHADDEWNERDPLTGAALNPALLAVWNFYADACWYPSIYEGIE
jgi:hypothetical protein